MTIKASSKSPKRGTKKATKAIRKIGMDKKRGSGAVKSVKKAAPKITADELTISNPVKKALLKAARVLGKEYVVVVRRNPDSKITTETVGRLVNVPESKQVRFERVTKEPRALAEVVQLVAEDFEPSAKAKALLRGVQQAKEDIAEAGGAFSLEQVCTLLGDVSRQSVHNKVKSGSIFSVKGPGGRVRFPAFQFTTDGPIEGMSELVRSFPSNNRWMLLNFLVHPDDQLGDRRPIDVLKAGDVAAVVRAAETLGEQGA